MSKYPYLSPDSPICWSNLSPQYIETDILYALEVGRKNIEEICQGKENSFESTFQALENATELLDEGWSRVCHLNEVDDQPARREAFSRVLPKVSEFYTSIVLNGDLWQRLKKFAESQKNENLGEQERRFIEETCQNFKQSGADADKKTKTRLLEIQKELAELTKKFGENVLDSTNAWEKIVDNEKVLEGLPDAIKKVLANTYEQKYEKKGKWLLTLHSPCLIPVLQYAENESLRKELWQASVKIAREGKYNNESTIWQVLELRQEEADLLGKKNFADFILSRRMAKNGSNALQFIENLHQRIFEKFQEEQKKLGKYANSQLEKQEDALLNPWSIAYWTEKQRKEIFDFDAEKLRPYLSMDSVMDGMFRLCEKLFSIQIKSFESVEKWHEEVHCYQIFDAETNRYCGIFYTDWHPRESKRSGAWMDGLHIGKWNSKTKKLAPHTGVICGNLTPPSQNTPSLLTFEEVLTIFHEFGHLLHHLLGEARIASLSGISVPWDFVELPSQILENFCWERESLDFFAKHYQTGEKIPQILFEKMTKARKYMQASMFMQQLSMSKMDLELHLSPNKWKEMSLDEFSKIIQKDYSIKRSVEIPTMLHRFNHLFSSPVGYAAAYYSYKWAEVLDADAFTRFQKEGILNAEVGNAFRKEILALGNTKEANLLFQGFMGREPDEEALLRRAGLC